MDLFSDIKSILYSVLQIDEAVFSLTNETVLLGAIPEFDSMAVVSIITALEDKFGFFVDDDEIDAEIFETVGTLVEFIEHKLE